MHLRLMQPFMHSTCQHLSNSLPTCKTLFHHVPQDYNHIIRSIPVRDFHMQLFFIYFKDLTIKSLKHNTHIFMHLNDSTFSLMYFLTAIKIINTHNGLLYSFISVFYNLLRFPSVD